MASQKDIKAIYDTIDKFFRQSIHRNGDNSFVIYNYNTVLTQEEAQRSNYEYILHSLGLKKGDRILDTICGWIALAKRGKEPNKEGIG
jgi:cyclopropane fatty-acyl-phospholipid synthase-like methyltransferase